MSAAPLLPRPAASIVWGSGATVDPANLIGLTDPLLLSPLAPGERVWACQRCASGYHAESHRFLRERNGGRCVNCGHSGGLVPVTLPASGAPLPPPPPAERAARPLVELPRVRDFVGQAISFRGYVHTVHRSRQGTFFIKFEQTKSPIAGFKLVVFSNYVGRWAERGLDPFDYEGRWITAHGLMQEHDVWGLEILVFSPEAIALADGPAPARKPLVWKPLA